MSRLKQLEIYGQSPWLDDLHRGLFREGVLERLIREDGLKGITSNPAIFERVIVGSGEYQDALRGLFGQRSLGDAHVYEALAIEDVRSAADLLRPIYYATGGRDGFVSLEVSPHVAQDASASVEEAGRLWRAVGRENLMVKIPATEPGLLAIRQSIASGMNVNVTLLFSVERYEAVAEAYIAGVEDLTERGGDPASVASVASFFLSRIDAAVDARLDALGDAEPALAASVKDRVAIASAKLAYAKYEESFSTPRWRALASRGARPQRLLWASTSAKKASLPATYYVDALIGPETVNTMPPATLDAFRQQGKLDGGALASHSEGAGRTLEALDRLGLSLAAINAELLDDGLRSFADAYDRLLGGIAVRRHETGAQMTAPDDPGRKTRAQVGPGAHAGSVVDRGKLSTAQREAK